MKALRKAKVKGVSNESIKERFYTPFFDFIADHTEIIEKHPGNLGAAEQEAISKARSHLDRITLGDSEKAWPELRAYFLAGVDADRHINLNVRKKMGLKVLDEVKIGKKVRQFFRDTIGSPMWTMMRKVNERAELLYQHMKPTWGFTKNKRLTKTRIEEAIAGGDEALLELLGDRFNDRVMDEFVGPIVRKVTSAFGTDDDAISVGDIWEAWESTDGLENTERVVAFAVRLSETAYRTTAGIEGEPQIGVPQILLRKVRSHSSMRNFSLEMTIFQNFHLFLERRLSVPIYDLTNLF